MAKQLIGTAQNVFRFFGRVRFTVRWDSGETETLTVARGQFGGAIRRGDTIATIVADPMYTAEDLLRWNAPGYMPTPQDAEMTRDWPPETRRYYRIGGPAPR